MSTTTAAGPARIQAYADTNGLPPDEHLADDSDALTAARLMPEDVKDIRVRRIADLPERAIWLPDHRVLLLDDSVTELEAFAYQVKVSKSGG